MASGCAVLHGKCKPICTLAGRPEVGYPRHSTVVWNTGLHLRRPVKLINLYCDRVTGCGGKISWVSPDRGIGSVPTSLSGGSPRKRPTLSLIEGWRFASCFVIFTRARASDGTLPLRFPTWGHLGPTYLLALPRREPAGLPHAG